MAPANAQVQAITVINDREQFAAGLSQNLVSNKYQTGKICTICQGNSLVRYVSLAIAIHIAIVWFSYSTSSQVWLLIVVS